MLLTFVSAFYILKSKFSAQTYEKWFQNLIPNVRKFNLVIFCDDKSKPFLLKYINETNKDLIKIVKLEINQFYNYQYKEYWIENHKRNDSLNGSKVSTHDTHWKLNMLWSEKQSFVKRAMDMKLFETEWYGWMDIGYFRSEYRGDLLPDQIHQWPNETKIKKLNPKKIYYGMANNNPLEIQDTYQKIMKKDEYGLPSCEILTYGIAGGFFLIHRDKVNWWRDTYDERIKKYFFHNHLIKDDQNVVMDLIYNDMMHFEIVFESIGFNSWFLFQRYLF